MINAGAIMTVSMVEPGAGARAARLERVLEVWRQLSANGGERAPPIGYDDAA